MNISNKAKMILNWTAMTIVILTIIFIYTLFIIKLCEEQIVVGIVIALFIPSLAWVAFVSSEDGIDL